MAFEPFIRLLQMTISPVVLISAVGLLLLSVTNRISRPIDRCRALYREIKRGGATPSPSEQLQLDVLLRRAEVLRLSLGCLVFAILSAIAMILVMIATAFTPLILHEIIVFLLTLSVISILLSLALLLYDVTLALRALKLEVKG